eukprot:m.270901 g.270901  ORF g.270901 m.270901 type:complete len:398 (-) comp16265_c1_seq64:2013-3206(-)
MPEVDNKAEEVAGTKGENEVVLERELVSLGNDICNRPRLRGRLWWESIDSPKFVAAPMVWNSERAFRIAVRKHKVGLCYTPMVKAGILTGETCHSESCIAERDSLTAALKDICPVKGVEINDLPLIMQFCAVNAHSFVAAAQAVSPYVSAVDLNLGCPQQSAERDGFGAFLMDKPDDVYDIISSCVKAINIPVTAKMRVFESEEKTIEFARMLQSAGCSMIAVHGRLRAQRSHEGIVRYDTIRKIKEALDIPVIANGGIRDIEQAEHVLQVTNADGVMAATGLLRNHRLFDGSCIDPWRDVWEYLQIAREVPPPNIRYCRDHVLVLFGGREGQALKSHFDLFDMLSRNRKIVNPLQIWHIVRVMAHRNGEHVPSVDTVPLLSLGQIKKSKKLSLGKF